MHKKNERYVKSNLTLSFVFLITKLQISSIQ